VAIAPVTNSSIPVKRLYHVIIKSRSQFGVLMLR
jgi:hypothetical protein